MFLKELNMYLDIFKDRIENFVKNSDDKKEKRNLIAFQNNLLDGINYYKDLFAAKKKEVLVELEKMLKKYPVLNTKLDSE